MKTSTVAIDAAHEKNPVMKYDIIKVSVVAITLHDNVLYIDLTWETPGLARSSLYLSEDQ